MSKISIQLFFKGFIVYIGYLCWVLEKKLRVWNFLAFSAKFNYIIKGLGQIKIIPLWVCLYLEDRMQYKREPGKSWRIETARTKKLLILKCIIKCKQFCNLMSRVVLELEESRNQIKMKTYQWFFHNHVVLIPRCIPVIFYKKSKEKIGKKSKKNQII